MRNEKEIIDCSCKGINPECLRCSGKGYYRVKSHNNKKAIKPHNSGIKSSQNKEKTTIKDLKVPELIDQLFNNQPKFESQLIIDELRGRGIDTKISMLKKLYFSENIKQKKRINSISVNRALNQLSVNLDSLIKIIKTLRPENNHEITIATELHHSLYKEIKSYLRVQKRKNHNKKAKKKLNKSQTKKSSKKNTRTKTRISEHKLNNFLDQETLDKLNKLKKLNK